MGIFSVARAVRVGVKLPVFVIFTWADLHRPVPGSSGRVTLLRCFSNVVKSPILARFLFGFMALKALGISTLIPTSYPWVTNAHRVSAKSENGRCNIQTPRRPVVQGLKHLDIQPPLE